LISRKSQQLPHICLLFLFLLFCGEKSTAAEKQDESTSEDRQLLKINALAFGDVYWVASHHDPANEGIVSAWLRRAYLTFDSEFSKSLSGRLRFELNQSGEFEDFSFSADFKDLYLQAVVGEHKILLGLSGTPTFDVIEQTWGYRYLEKTPMDLQGVASRDTGLAAKGPLTRDGSIRYRVMYGSELEFGNDSRDSNKWMAALSFEPGSHWLIDLYVDFEALQRSRNDRWTMQAFVAYRTENTRVGLQYSDQDRDDDPGIELASLFAVRDLSETWSLIARVDRLFKPSVRGEDIDYLPFDPTANATLLILGAEARPHRFVGVIPNIEYIGYDDPAGPTPRPDDDLLVRLTLRLKY